MTALALPPIIGRMVATADRLDAVVEVLPLATPEDESFAAEFVRAVETLIRESEAARKAQVAPLKKQTTEIDKAYRDPRNRLKALGDKIRFRLQEAAENRERARVLALQAVQVAPDLATANAALATVQAAPATPGVTMRWRWEVVGVTPEQVPDSYKRVDMDALRGLCKVADGGGAEPVVPGVVFERKAHSVVRTG